MEMILVHGVMTGHCGVRGVCGPYGGLVWRGSVSVRVSVTFNVSVIVTVNVSVSVSVSALSLDRCQSKILALEAFKASPLRLMCRT